MAAIENEDLVEAFMKSNKTLDEAIEFFTSDVKEEAHTHITKRRGGRKCIPRLQTDGFAKQNGRDAKRADFLSLIYNV